MGSIQYVNNMIKMKAHSRVCVCMLAAVASMNGRDDDDDNNNNNNNNVIYIAPFTMCSRRLEESRKKMRFKFVFEPVHMIDNTDTARQLIPKIRPSHRKGTIARLAHDRPLDDDHVYNFVHCDEML